MRLPLQNLELEIRRLVAENKTLREENNAYKVLNSGLTRQNTEWADENRKKHNPNLELARKNTRLDEENQRMLNINLELRRENNKLEDEKVKDDEVRIKREKMDKMNMLMECYEPLAICALKIRMRFYEQSREHLGFGQANDTFIQIGNVAAHEGDMCADSAMILLLGSDLHAEEQTFDKIIKAVSEEDKKATKEDLNKMFAAIYGFAPFSRMPHHTLSLRVIEATNIMGTVVSFSSYQHDKDEYEDFDLQRLRVCSKQTRHTVNNLKYAPSATNLEPQEIIRMINECPAIKMKVVEMRHIKETCTKRRHDLKRRARDMA